MSVYSETLSPDGLSGIVFALEGVKHAIVLLNGPTGCKFYHGATSDSQTIRQLEFDPLNFPPQWYFGQPRVPCTYLDDADYVYGSEEKLVSALEYLRDKADSDLVAIVNSPGAALIGDDLAGIARRVLGDAKSFVVVESPGYSTNICKGHEAGCRALLEQLGLGCDEEGAGAGACADADASPRDPARPRINVLGLSLFHRNHTGDVAELRRLFGLVGVEVGCVLGGGSGLPEILTMPRAALNVVIHPEMGRRSAAWLSERFGMPTYECPGPPIGFAATERMIQDICGLLGIDPTPALDDCAHARARAYAFVSRVHSLTGLPKGVRYAVEGTYGELLAYEGFLTGYFGMMPACLRPLCKDSDEMAGALREQLTAQGLSQALDRDLMRSDFELLFGSGNTIASCKLAASREESAAISGSAGGVGNRRFSGIETMLPTLGYYDVVPKTHLGSRGALQLVELVLNGLSY